MIISDSMINLKMFGRFQKKMPKVAPCSAPFFTRQKLVWMSSDYKDMTAGLLFSEKQKYAMTKEARYETED